MGLVWIKPDLPDDGGLSREAVSAGTTVFAEAWMTAWMKPSKGHPVVAVAGVLKLRASAGEPTGSAGAASSRLSKTIEFTRMRMRPDSPRCLNMGLPALYTCSSTCLYM